MFDHQGAQVTEGELVARVLAGERDTYAELVARHQAMLYRHALGMVGQPDVAADLVQDALVRAFTRLDTCQDPDRFGAWVFRILRNRCLDYLKDVRRQTVSLDDEALHPADGEEPGHELERAELRHVLTDALGTLPPAQREAFLLKHVEDRPYEEMAELLGASVSALKMRVMRAREALQAVLVERGVTGV